MLSHLFLNYFILSDFYFIPILLDRENGTTILIVFYSYFKPLNKVVYFISIYSKQVKKKPAKQAILILFFFPTSLK